MFRGTQTYRVSALWMQRSGPPPPPPLRFPTTPAGVYTGVRDGWLDGATLPLAFIYNQIPCIPATDARLNFYPLLLPPPSYVYTRADASEGAVCYNAHERTQCVQPSRGENARGRRKNETGCGEDRKGGLTREGDSR